jgi:hypothetical protein
MGRWILCVTVLATALASGCKSGPDDMTLLELESLRFKAANESVRADDLQTAYEKRRARADRLSIELLELQAVRERQHGEFDRVHGEFVRIEREHSQAVRDRDAAAAALQKVTAERKKLSAALDTERAALLKLQAELAKVQAQRAAAELKTKPAE